MTGPDDLGAWRALNGGADLPASGPPRPDRYIRLGFVGHRPREGLDLDAHAPTGVDAAFDMVARAFGAALADDRLAPPICSGAVPELVLVSSLAAGADQIAAARFVAMEPVFKDAGGLASALELVLPFGREASESLTRGDGGAAFGPFLARARAVLELYDHAPRDLSTLTPEEAAVERRSRELRYIAAADIVVRQADLLVALWDGRPGEGPGGTATSVALALREGVPVLRVDPADGAVTLLQRQRRHGDLLATEVDHAFAADPPRCLASLVARILSGPTRPEAADSAAGQGDGQGHGQDHGHAHGEAGLADPDKAGRYFGAAARAGELAWRWSDSTAYERLLRLTGARVSLRAAGDAGDQPPDFATIMREPQAAVTEMALRQRLTCPPLPTDYLARSVAAGGLTLPATPRAGGQLLAPWAHADANATWLSHAYRSAYVLTFGLGSLAVLVGLLGLLGPSSNKWIFVALEIIILAAAIWTFVNARRGDLHARYIDARHMAEQFRPAWALLQLGLAGRKVLAARAPWSAWAVQAHVGAVGLPTDRLTPDRLREIARAAQHRLVIDQLAYHRGNRERMRRLHHQLEKLGFGSLVAAPTVGAAYVAATLGAKSGHVLPVSLGVAVGAVLLVLSFVDVADRRHRWLIRAVALACAAGAAVPALGYGATALATILMAGLPAFAAAVAGVRYQGDFERFAKRSDRTARELARIGLALAAFGERNTPTFMELRDILVELERVLLQDIEDWRFVYAERPSPEP